jgi:hypothetical protein
LNKDAFNLALEKLAAVAACHHDLEPLARKLSIVLHSMPLEELQHVALPTKQRLLLLLLCLGRLLCCCTTSLTYATSLLWRWLYLLPPAPSLQ